MFILKKASLQDCSLIHEMAHVVFPATYKEILSEGQLDYMLDWMYSPENLEKQMKEGHVYFIAYKADVPCGYLSIQQEEEHLFHLQKIYVLPVAQGEGLGRFLFTEAIRYIKNVQPEPCRMILNVNRDNKAVSFYQKLGMKKIDEGDFNIGNGYYMNDYIMGVDI